MKKLAVNLFLIAWFAVLVIDAAPPLGNWQASAKTKLDPILDRCGLWQNRWSMFAPNPDQTNTQLTATFEYPDGQETEWASPDWRAMSVWQKFINFREAEFTDTISLEQYRIAWDSYADYLYRNRDQPENLKAKPNVVYLFRNSCHIPEPTEYYVKQFPELPPKTYQFLLIRKEYSDQ